MTSSRRRFVGIIASVALISLACAVAGQPGSIQVKIKDTHGKPAAGTKVWLERVDSKTAAQEMVTGASGESIFRNVIPGTYKVSAYDSRIPAAAATMVKASAGGVSSVTLSLDKMARGAQASKQRKHYVWVAGETGTHIGGGRWVEVEDDASGTGANAVDKRGAQMLNQPQSFQLRPFQPPGQ